VSVEAIYPSQQQPRAANPLFARSLRRRKLALMGLLSVSGLGLLLLQIVPMTALAENPALPPQTTAETVMQQPAPQVQASQAPKAAAKTIRQIQIYNLPVEPSQPQGAKKS